jgi:carboxyl-terminal processing protease
MILTPTVVYLETMINHTGILQFMKNKVLIPLVAVGVLAAFFSFKYISSDAAEDNSPATAQRKSLIVSTVLRAVKEGHFAPRPVDDSLSYTIYHKLLDNLDYERKFFTQQDIDVLKADEFRIDDQLNNGEVDFFDRLNKVFIASIDRADAIQKEALATPFDFSTDEKITLSGDDMPWPADEAALKIRWRQYLKYRTLARYVDLKKERDKKHDNKDSAKVALKTDAALEAEARQGIRKTQEAYFRRLRKFDDNERFSLFVNTIANAEDPHTDYFPPKTKEAFDIQMSGSFVGIGASLKEEEGKVKVAAILPGTASWRQGELKAGDEITKVAQGAGEPVDIQGFDIDEVVQKIRGKKGTEVRLTVKKVDGSVKVIPIIRDEVKIEETFAKSAIFKSAGGPVGYIYLPEFYADFKDMNGRRCADDVAQEIIKLKNAGVTGIILDLRYNGGGSLSDVVDMAGLFIDEGPIVQVKSTDASPSTLRDSQKGTLYDGPLAIMVNGGSASASEIMAAAMQDYKRAVIVGSPTFGKGTVQKVISLDEYLDPITQMRMMNEPPIGHVKLTVQKFYRVNGGSTQLRGVIPDIKLPDPYSHLDLGERKDKTALKWDEIPAANYHPVNGVNIPQLAAASAKRVAANEAFKLIEENGAKVKQQQEDNSYSLNEVAYAKEMEEVSVMSKKQEELEKKGTPIPVTNPREDYKRINADSSTVTKNKNWLKNLQKDIYISETINIINDMAKPAMKVNMGMGLK